ncbi:MAG: DNA methyltransferase [Gemmatimonadota bacterium]
MQTLRHAAERLAAANTVDGRVALAAALGFDDTPVPVDAESARRLGISDEAADAFVIRGHAALRALLFSARGGEGLRETFTRLAASLAGNTAHVLWVLIGSSDDDVGVACWTPSKRGARVVALVAHREHIVASDAEALCALAAGRTGNDLLVYAHWCDVLGRETLSRQFYRILEQRVRALGDSLAGVGTADRAELALLCVSRLLFLSFLETKGWLDGDRAFLSRTFDECMASGGGFHRRVLLPLFFGTLNTPLRRRAPRARAFGAIPFLNGGLFSKSALERRHSTMHFSDEAIGALFSDLLGKYRFTGREGQALWSEAAIDPEMLGRAFESLMASRERRVSGAFYTPQDMVSHVADRALMVALSTDRIPETEIARALAGERLRPSLADRLRVKLRTFTVLDPACGSGAFLVYVLERLGDLHRAAGDARTMAAIRRDVLARAIHGVDINPTAVWLCELRLWLSVVIESDETRMSAVPPLPNLDCSVRVGDTLSGDAFAAPPTVAGPPAALMRLRERYVRAAGPSKAPLRKALAREERRRALAAIARELDTLSRIRRERLEVQRGTNMFGERTRPSAEARTEMRVTRQRAAALRRERRRIEDGGALPFSFPSHFGAAHARGGFGLIIGNPPWVRLHNIPAATRLALRERYDVFRDAAWECGARQSHTARGFAAQVDLAALFVERSVALAADTGCIALLLPTKLWRSLAGGGVRRLLAARTSLRVIEDWSEAPAAFDAAVYPSVIIASRSAHDADEVAVSVRRPAMSVDWNDAPSSLRLEERDAGSPWLLLPLDVRTAFDRISTRGRPLGESTFGRAMLGVKCGCNEAFMVEAGDHVADSVAVAYRGRKGMVERELIRPLLRGDGVSAWNIPDSRSAIVWTHAPGGLPLPALPAGASRWLAPWRRQLTNRTDLRGSRNWWALFRTESADSSRTRVVWSDFGRVPRAAILPAGDRTVPLNSCYVVSCDDPVDAMALAALLNTPLAAAWLNAIAEPARGGWHRYLAWTVSLLPLPADWERARDILAPLAQRAMAGNTPTSAELLTAACRAYGVRRDDVAPLVVWCHALLAS